MGYAVKINQDSGYKFGISQKFCAHGLHRSNTAGSGVVLKCHSWNPHYLDVNSHWFDLTHIFFSQQSKKKNSLTWDSYSFIIFYFFFFRNELVKLATKWKVSSHSQPYWSQFWSRNTSWYTPVQTRLWLLVKTTGSIIWVSVSALNVWRRNIKD